MRGRNFSAVLLKGLIFASLLLTGRLAWTQDASRPTAEVKQAPFDVLAVRRQYYQDLDDAKKDAIRQVEAAGMPLSYNPDGTVVKDAAYREVTERYNSRRQELLQTIKSDANRDAAVKALFEAAHVPLATETGTGAGSSEFSGALSDRDVMLKGVVGLQHLEQLKTLARENGYHVVPGTGYVKIPELDMIVWEPSDANEYARTFNQEDKAVRLNDPEVVIDYKHPGVTSQIHKVENFYREGDEVPDSTQDEFEMVAGLAKAAYKSVKAVDKDLTGKTVSPEEFKELELLKSRKLTKDDLVDPLDSPEVQKQKLREAKDKYLRILQICLPLDEQQRDAKIQQVEAEGRRLREKAWELEQKRKEIPAGSDPAEEKRLFDELQTVLGDKEDRRVELNALNRKKNQELAQQKVVVAKNSAMGSVFRGAELTWGTATTFEPGATTEIARTLENEGPPKERAPIDLDKAREGFSFWSAVLSVTEAVTESKTLNVLNKKLGPLGQLNQIVGGVEGFNYETGEGMRDYIRSEIERYRKNGRDVDDDPQLQAEIRRRAIIRATGLGTWEGSKAIPVLGNLVQGAEDFYRLSESSIGLTYDRWKSRQIEDANRFLQEGNLQDAISHAKKSRDMLRSLMESAQGYAKETRQLAELKSQLEAEQQTLEHEIVTRFAFLESLVAEATNKQSPLADPATEESLRSLGPAIAAETKVAQIFVRDCEAAIERVKAGGVPREELAEEQGGLGKRLMDIDTEYFRLTILLEQAGQSVRLITQAQDGQQIYQQLVEYMERAGTLAQIEEDRADRMRDALKLHEETVRAWGEEKTRIKDVCDRFAVRAAAVDEESLKSGLNSIRDEIAGFHINARELNEFATLPGDLKLSADRLVLLTNKKPPLPPQGVVPPPAELVEKAEKAQALLRELDKPAAEMTRVVELARERFKQLREMFPMDPPVFSLTAKEAATLTYDFVVSGSRLPVGAKLRYSWDFGDKQWNVTDQNTDRHAFAAPGKYTVRVTVYAERIRVSEEIGTASLTIGQNETPTPPVVEPDKKQVALVINIVGRTKLDFVRRPANLTINGDRMVVDLVQEIRDYDNSAPMKIHLEAKVNRQNGQTNVDGTFTITETWNQPGTQGEFIAAGIIRGNLVGTRLNLTAIDQSQEFSGTGSRPQNINIMGRRFWIEGIGL